MPLRVAEVVDERALDGEPLAPAGVRVDLQLEAVLLALAGGGLVVDDREPLLAVRVVDDDVGAADDGRRAEVELERPLDLPDAMEVVLPLVDVAVDELRGPAPSSRGGPRLFAAGR